MESLYCEYTNKIQLLLLQFFNCETENTKMNDDHMT